jgi:hypothetical protein
MIMSNLNQVLCDSNIGDVLSKMNISSTFGLFGCFDSMGGSIGTLLQYLNLMGDMWILSNYLNVMLLKYDEKIKYIHFDVKAI